MVARPLVGWALPSNRAARICRASDLDANGAGSLTLWLIQSFSGRKANQATKRIGRPIAIQIPFRLKNPISFSICFYKFDSRLASGFYFRAVVTVPRGASPWPMAPPADGELRLCAKGRTLLGPASRPVGRRIPKYRPLLGRDPSRDGFQS